MRTVASWKEAADAAKLDEVEATEMTLARVSPAVVAALATPVVAMWAFHCAAVDSGVVAPRPAFQLVMRLRGSGVIDRFLERTPLQTPYQANTIDSMRSVLGGTYRACDTESATG
jgi:hypothetical protein